MAEKITEALAVSGALVRALLTISGRASAQYDLADALRTSIEHACRESDELLADLEYERGQHETFLATISSCNAEVVRWMELVKERNRLLDRKNEEIIRLQNLLQEARARAAWAHAASQDA